MSNKRFHVIPQSRPWSVLYLIIGALVLLTTGRRVLTDGAAILPVIALVCASVLIVTAVIGLVRPHRTL